MNSPHIGSLKLFEKFSYTELSNDKVSNFFFTFWLITMEPLFEKNSNFWKIASYEQAFLIMKNFFEFYSYSAFYRHLNWIFRHFFHDFYKESPRTFFSNAVEIFCFCQIQEKRIINRCFEKKSNFDNF